MPRPCPIEDQIFEIERELKVRGRVYQRWMQTNKMKPEVAGQQMERLEAARDTLIAVRAERARATLSGFALAQPPHPGERCALCEEMKPVPLPPE